MPRDLNSVTEAHCYVLQCRQIACEHVLSVVIVYHDLLTINLPTDLTSTIIPWLHDIHHSIVRHMHAHFTCVI